MKFNNYFDKTFVINIESRKDRWDHVLSQAAEHGMSFERFNAYSGIEFEGKVNGNVGCTASHRGILEVINYHRYEKTLVLEDDFQFEYPPEKVDEIFSSFMENVPDDWDILYFGCHYGSKPRERIASNVIRPDRVLTTSSYAIRGKAARFLAPHIYGSGGIDSFYSNFSDKLNYYVVSPRFLTQYASVSDLTGLFTDNAQCMRDPNHEKMV